MDGDHSWFPLHFADNILVFACARQILGKFIGLLLILTEAGVLLNAEKAVVPSRQAEPVPSCNGWRSQLVVLHVDSGRVKLARQWRTLGHGRKRQNMYLSCTMYLRHRVQPQAFCRLSYRFHLANFSIVMNHVFVFLPTGHARGCHCKCLLLQTIGSKVRNVARQVPMMSQLSLSPRFLVSEFND